MTRADAGPRARERPAAVLRVDRVRKAYEQIADQLRELIRDGELAQGERLPNETVLAAEFGVSRATVREALRLLAAQNLIRTAKGAAGGSYVMVPSVDHISDFLQGSIKLLTEAQDVTLEELLEARELLEVPAARLAAARHRQEDVERLRAAIPPDGRRLTTQEHFAHNKDFHTVVIESSGNTLLAIAAQPVFTVLQTHLARSVLGSRFHGAVADQHRAISAAIAAEDARAAADEMHAHLEFLRPFYEKAWRRALHARERL